MDEDDDLPRPGKVWENSAGPSLAELLKQQAAATPSPAPKPAEPISNVESVDPSDLAGVWKALLALLSQKGPGLPGLLHHGRFVGIEDGKAVIRYSKQHETFVKMFDRNGKKDQVRDALSLVMRQNVGVVFEIDPDAAPAEAEARIAAPAAAPLAQPSVKNSPPSFTPPPPQAPRLTPEQKQELAQDELVRAVMNELGAEIVRVSDDATN